MAVGLTPAYAQVDPEDALLGEHGEGQQCVQVHALHQQPVVIGRHAVLHEQEHQAAAQGVLGEGGPGEEAALLPQAGAALPCPAPDARLPWSGRDEGAHVLWLGRAPSTGQP